MLALFNSTFVCVLLLVWHRDSPANIELLEPMEGSAPGDRVFVEGYGDNETTHVPELLNPKKKVWDKLQVSDRLHISDVTDKQLFRTTSK